MDGVFVVGSRASINSNKVAVTFHDGVTEVILALAVKDELVLVVRIEFIDIALLAISLSFPTVVVYCAFCIVEWIVSVDFVSTE